MARRAAAAVAAVLLLAGCGEPDTTAEGLRLPPSGAAWDYQLGGDYPPADDVEVVVRDWFAGEPLADAWNGCYVNAFQTQAEEDGVDRPDEASAWPQDLVLTDLGSDPGWPGELLVDITTAEKREAATAHVRPMLASCAEDGFDGVELDNLDSWTRFDGSDVRVPFGQDEAVAYAALLVDAAHDVGLTVGRKNTPQLDRQTSLEAVGFDFAIAEECGAYDECGAYTEVFGDHVLAVEYTDEGLRAACEALPGASVVGRDVGLSTPDDPDHVDERC